MMVLWIIIIGVLVYFLLGGDMNLNAIKRKNADDHLNERLAKGEISVEEYQELKSVIKENK